MTAKILPFRTGRMVAIETMDFAEAEALLAAFHAKYPELIAAMGRLTVQHERLSDVIQRCSLEVKELSKHLPREDKRVRTSAKTGATWPKPKGSY